MSRGVCTDTERRIEIGSKSAVIDYQNIIGAKVKIMSATMQNGWKLKEPGKIYTISEVGFRISIDGKCYTIIALEGITDRTFALKDLIFVELNTEEENEQNSQIP